MLTKVEAKQFYSVGPVSAHPTTPPSPPTLIECLVLIICMLKVQSIERQQQEQEEKLPDSKVFQLQLSVSGVVVWNEEMEVFLSKLDVETGGRGSERRNHINKRRCW